MKLVDVTFVTLKSEATKTIFFFAKGFFFTVLFSTTSSVVFIAARISYIRFFIAVHIHSFHTSTNVEGEFLQYFAKITSG